MVKGSRWQIGTSLVASVMALAACSSPLIEISTSSETTAERPQDDEPEPSTSTSSVVPSNTEFTTTESAQNTSSASAPVGYDKAVESLYEAIERTVRIESYEVLWETSHSALGDLDGVWITPTGARLRLSWEGVELSSVVLENLVFTESGGPWLAKPNFNTDDQGSPSEGTELSGLSDLLSDYDEVDWTPLSQQLTESVYTGACSSSEGQAGQTRPMEDCPPGINVNITVDHDTGLISEIRKMGEFDLGTEDFPDEGLLDSTMTITISPLAEGTAIEAPTNVDWSEYDCIAEYIGVDPINHAEASLRLSESVAPLGQELFRECFYMGLLN